MTPTDLAYRRTATEGASGFGLLISLYDTLAGDLRRAAEAERNNDLERRCREVDHAMLVIGYLEDWTHRGSDGELAQQLIAFYSSLRRKMIEAQTTRSIRILEEQMALVLDLREHWQQIDARTEPGNPEVLPPVQTANYPKAFAEQSERRSGNWSA
ncbi:MAG TPA: flagellar export chaperone FliS [Terracidiphilus sp.]|nr:flagellar export chaperone FliS [Terracidiphilus sp.]